MKNNKDGEFKTHEFGDDLMDMMPFAIHKATGRIAIITEWINGPNIVHFLKTYIRIHY